MNNTEETTKRIRTILLKDWDPLGVGDNPNLADEYDAYIPSVLALLGNHCTVDELERHLLGVEASWELAPDSTAAQTARKIFDTLQECQDRDA
ncbi:hypothetical protein [Methylocapsa palsarum]|uniref:DUF1871 domain-containing protein n=1 Tax=Methylocapsa palsarum TaxID=1612308 RepID=A0A1I4AHZ7_9HYPH|nr:hypothetical protein [Methylocapsa palsarum]SFK55551.1 hypothetical protein SAMN05444581_11090 [Methylocapsa palsarum]